MKDKKDFSSKSKQYNSKKKNYSKSPSRKPRDTRDDSTFAPDDKASKYSDRRGQSVADYVGTSNDPAWYNRNTRLINDVTKISFSNQLGREVQVAIPYGEPHTGSIVGGNFKVPGVLALSMVNTPGLARDASDGVNIAAAGLFQFIRKNLSTVATYAAADVMMYVLGLDSMYSMYSNIARAFGLINAYSAINLYMPNCLLHEGYDMSTQAVIDFKKNINNYRSRFNNLIYKASTLYLPTDFTITSRHAWLYSNYFMDGESSKSQLYIHRMAGHHLINEVGNANGTALEFIENDITISGLLDQFEQMIERYRNSDSMLKIAADMRRAFEGRSQWKLAYVDENYMVLPVFDKVVLDQIHNTRIYGNYAYEDLVGHDIATDGGFNVTQSVGKNIVLFDPTWTVSYADYENEFALIKFMQPCTWDVILDFHKQDVSSDDIVEATRNALVVQFINDPSLQLYTWRMLDMGVDMCVKMDMSVSPDNSNANFRGSYVPLADPAGPYVNKMVDLSHYSMFDWAPMMWIGAEPSTSEDDNGLAVLVADLDNYTVIDKQLVARINANVVASMWSIPEFGGYDA